MNIDRSEGHVVPNTAMDAAVIRRKLKGIETTVFSHINSFHAGFYSFSLYDPQDVEARYECFK